MHRKYFSQEKNILYQAIYWKNTVRKASNNVSNDRNFNQISQTSRFVKLLLSMCNVDEGVVNIHSMVKETSVMAFFFDIFSIRNSVTIELCVRKFADGWMHSVLYVEKVGLVS